LRPVKTKKKGKLSAPSTAFLSKLLFSTMPYLLSLLVVGILFGSVIVYALNSPTFELKEVHVLNVGSLTPAQAFQFSELKPGENLIQLDLLNVQQVIKKRHPEFKEVRVRRVLPSRVDVVLKRRTPVAQALFASRFVQVDKDLVILPGSAQTPFRNLTVIEGSPIPREGLYVGVTLSDAGTKKAARLASVIRQSNILRNHQLSKIDITDPRNTSFWVDGEIEVRIGNGHFNDRLKILDQTLKTVALDKDRIKYIDLRFDDVVIGPR
jgi:cell division septal protein FtsQ